MELFFIEKSPCVPLFQRGNREDHGGLGIGENCRSLTYCSTFPSLEKRGGGDFLDSIFLPLIPLCPFFANREMRSGMKAC